MVAPLGRASADARLSGRERWMIRGVLGVLAVLAVVLAVAVGTAGRSSAHGCIYATIPGPVGAEQLDQCGSEARATCLSASVPGTYPVETAHEVERECRKAGLPVGG